MKVFGVYIIRSLRNVKFYVGSFGDRIFRLGERNSGRVKTTKNLVPWELKRFIPCLNFSEARRADIN